MADHSLFFVYHEVQDQVAWGKLFEHAIQECQGTHEESIAKPMWEGNACHLWISSTDGNATACLWKCKPDMSLDDFQAFIDRFTGAAAKNYPSKVDKTVGGEMLNNETFIQDVKKLGLEGHAQPYAGEGNLWCVRHIITDDSTWPQIFAATFGLLKGKKTTTEMCEAWRMPAGVKGVFTSALGDGHGLFCLFETPKDYKAKEVQTMVDNFSSDTTNSPMWQVNHETALNGRLLHPDFYTSAAIEYAENA